MRLTRQTNYAMRILMYCATNSGRLSRVADIAAAYSLSELYLFKVMQPLVEAGLMETGMRLCTFDDHDLLDCIPMRIDSVAQDCPALALAAFELMQTLIAGSPPTKTAQVINPRIRWRSRR